jgi:hypothetical protein
MIGTLLAKLADRFAAERFEITRAWTKEPYLTRWSLFGRRFGNDKAVYLHHFHRSDADELHTHPWPFTSVILVGGYWEVTPAPGWKDGVGPVRRRWYGPGRVLRRPVTHVHRVELPPGADAWTLVFHGPRERTWGFVCPDKGWIPHWQHQARAEKTGNGCG